MHLKQLNRVLSLALLLPAIAMLTMPLSGCDDGIDEEPDIFRLEGDIKQIASDFRSVTVESRLPKSGKSVEVKVELTESTEVLINGVLADVWDVRVGEHAQGNVLVKERDGKKRFEVLRVSINRPTEDLPNPLLDAPPTENPTAAVSASPAPEASPASSTPVPTESSTPPSPSSEDVNQ